MAVCGGLMAGSGATICKGNAAGGSPWNVASSRAGVLPVGTDAGPAARLDAVSGGSASLATGSSVAGKGGSILGSAVVTPNPSSCWSCR